MRTIQHHPGFAVSLPPHFQRPLFPAHLSHLLAWLHPKSSLSPVMVTPLISQFKVSTLWLSHHVLPSPLLQYPPSNVYEIPIPIHWSHCLSTLSLHACTSAQFHIFTFALTLDHLLKSWYTVLHTHTYHYIYMYSSMYIHNSLVAFFILLSDEVPIPVKHVSSCHM